MTEATFLCGSFFAIRTHSIKSITVASFMCVVLYSILRNKMVLSTKTNTYDLLPDSYIFYFLLCLCELRQKTNYFALVFNSCGHINAAFEPRTLILTK